MKFERQEYPFFCQIVDKGTSEFTAYYRVEVGVFCTMAGTTQGKWTLSGSTKGSSRVENYGKPSMQNKNRWPQFVTMSHKYPYKRLNLLDTKQPIMRDILRHWMFCNKRWIWLEHLLTLNVLLSLGCLYVNQRSLFHQQWKGLLGKFVCIDINLNQQCTPLVSL